MDCRRFRSQHLSFLDDTLCGRSIGEMQEHLARCPGCAAHDQLVRRSLVLARSIEPITPSADFQNRLYDRLRREPVESALDDDALTGDAAFLIPQRGWQPSRRALMAVAASMALMTSVAYYQGNEARARADAMALSRPPLPDPIPLSVPSAAMTPGFVGAVLSGNPVLPAAMVASQVPVDFLTTVVPMREPMLTSYPALEGFR